MVEKNEANLEVPDFDRFSNDFDRFLGLIAPVSEALFERLPVLKAGDRILDVACGTGEPGLTLAGRHPAVKVTGIDAAPNMVKIAAEKAHAQGISNAQYLVMKAEEATFTPGSFSGVISRFGLGMFGDTGRAAEKVYQSLADGGFLNVAVWHDMTRNTFYKTMFETINAMAGSEQPLVSTFPGNEAENHFKNAGFKDISSVEFTWHYVFESEAKLLEMIKMSAAHMLKLQFDKLENVAAREDVYAAIVTGFGQFKNAKGECHIPHTCLLVAGTR